MLISGSAGDRVVNSLQSQFHWQTLTRWENYCQLIIIHIYIHIIFHRPGLPWKDRVFRRCYPLISMYEFIAIELAIWTQTYETLNSPQDMLSEISLPIRFQVSTIMKLSAPLGNWSKHQNSTPLVQVILWEYSEQILYLLPYSISVTLTTSSTFPCSNESGQVIQLGKAAAATNFSQNPPPQLKNVGYQYPSPPFCTAIRDVTIWWLSLDEWLVGWSGAVVMLAMSFVASLHHCFFRLVCLQILFWHSWIHESSKLILIISWIWL